MSSASWLAMEVECEIVLNYPINQLCVSMRCYALAAFTGADEPCVRKLRLNEIQFVIP